MASSVYQLSRLRLAPLLLVLSLCACAQPLKPDVQRALSAIRVAELKGDLSFLASDALQGRYTPSPGLQIAAEFIASKFRAIGLKPGAGDSYFQTAALVERTLPRVMTPLMGNEAGHPISVEPARIRIISASAALHLKAALVVKVVQADPEKLNGLELQGKLVLAPALDLSVVPAAERASARAAARAFDKAVAAAGALLEIKVGASVRPAATAKLLFAEDLAAVGPPIIQVDSPELEQALHSNAALTISFDIPAPLDQNVTASNVIGILPGFDPRLKSTCVLLTAHYDHIGTTATAGPLSLSEAEGADKIFNGANDDGSGTVSVIEIARALSRLHLRRSLVFIAFFGEERGLIGSTYYGRHPVFPLAQTVADLNLEQVGRTDASNGPQIATASLTGYDYSGVTRFLEAAGRQTGIEIYKDETGSDAYFERSDNAALAEHGVPAHTLTTAFEYPDYHAVGDEWQKIDYANMAKVDRAVALAVANMAEATLAPAWNEENPKTKPFVQARQASY